MRLAPHVNLTAQLSPLASGTAGIAQTLRVMRQMVQQYRVDPSIRQAATNITFMTPEKDEFSEVCAIYHFVRDSIRYVKDVHEVETLSTPDKTLAGRIGDCDDQSTLLAALLESIGYKTRFVVAGYWEPGVFEHVYVQVFANGEWFSCDATEQSAYFGWEPEDPAAYMIERV